jgi:hypothetical protein
MDSLAELFSFSLSKRKALEDAFWIHPVLHNWARERLEPQSTQKKAGEAVILCGRIAIHRDDKQPHDWVFERRIWPHINSVLTSLKALSKPINTGTFAKGEILFQEASSMGQLCEQHGFYSEMPNICWSAPKLAKKNF